MTGSDEDYKMIDASTAFQTSNEKQAEVVKRELKPIFKKILEAADMGQFLVRQSTRNLSVNVPKVVATLENLGYLVNEEEVMHEKVLVISWHG